MGRDVAIATRYSNSFILCIISITRITTKRFSKTIGLAMRYSIHTEICNY